MILKSLLKWGSIAIAALAFAIGAAVFVPEWHRPSQEEIALAQALALAGKSAVTNERQTVLWRASRGRVEINAYGFVDAPGQESALKALYTALGQRRDGIEVYVNFFPSREYSVEKSGDGRQVERLKKAPAVRQVQLN